MIGLDTNVLIRVFIDDNSDQVSAARRLVESASSEGLFVSDIVLVELVWTLTSRFKASKDAILDVLDRILDGSPFVLESRQDVRRATQLFAAGRADFPDCMIALRGIRFGAAATFSFDRRAVEASLFLPVPV
ncbi:PIN domain-containing protein [Afifella marina]|uniref:Ribonuclease VapC n=1 Tax=Afifella marina DSM 2698 TaxID=1120955 RepID=A0A1G5MJA6_AFIMA|nr:type II toxin-antitoxin system VapC family toxin [Afifella marina]SCZ25266.1 Predicted nucleic-acid-binding protein, contains PIN domain [Afifella marina DSM 2698]